MGVEHESLRALFLGYWGGYLVKIYKPTVLFF